MEGRVFTVLQWLSVMRVTTTIVTSKAPKGTSAVIGIQQYHTRSIVKTGIVEVVPPEDLKNDNNTTRSHYLPHLAVVRKDRETTKVRVVYDGSAKDSKKERSLNDCLQTGPNLLPHVFNMIANFRKNIVGLTADI